MRYNWDVNLNVCSNVHIVRWFYTGGFISISIFKKKPTKDNNQRDFFIKILTFFVVMKSCLLLRDDGRKQRLDINLIDCVIYWCVIDIRDPNFYNKHASDLRNHNSHINILIHLVIAMFFFVFLLALIFISFNRDLIWR